MKAILVGVNIKNQIYSIDYCLDELENLAKALDITSIHRISQNLDKPNPKSYVGSGKISEIVMAVNALDADCVIFDDELSPAQMKNLSDSINVEIYDRTYLILKIFEQRSKTVESRLEVKLANLLYRLPRLHLINENISRSGGGSGFTSSKGAGETQLELDRRHLEAEIINVRKQLDTINKMKDQAISKRKRNDIPVVALVGYTNAGKSSTMNTILRYTNNEKYVLEKNQLFATLETYLRRINYNKKEFILTDTIGFVSKLPHHLVNGFYQTLKEVANADLIIHVVDSSSIYINEQLNVVNSVLSSLNASAIPTIYLLNKWDSTIYPNLTIMGEKSLEFSNKTGLNVDKLLNLILENVGPSTIHLRCVIPYKESKLMAILEEKATIYSKDYQGIGAYYDVEVPIKLYHLFHMYDLDNIIN